ncbi:MAG: J domain-containing protein [Thermodesulfobacteriota bacterium]|nr:J domain-containing protein [Thermodesulfobacteriota bacterium]
MKYTDYYKTLGVERSATQTDIKKAYRGLARKHHPDTNRDNPGSEKRFKEINEAYEVLKDPDKRSRYDALGANWQQGQTFTPPGGQGFEDIFGNSSFGARGGQRFSFDFGSRGAQSDGFSDFFETLFGNAGMGNQPFKGTGNQGAPSRGKDVETTVEISLEEANQGSSRILSIGARRLTVKIPAGATDGMKIRIAGQGSMGSDIYLKIKIARHKRYRLDGSDIEVDFPITPWDAVLGATSEVQTLDGKIKLKIPAGISSGQKLRFKGRGLARKGDFYVRIKIVVPKKPSHEETELFKELRKVSGFHP